MSHLAQGMSVSPRLYNISTFNFLWFRKKNNQKCSPTTMANTHTHKRTQKNKLTRLDTGRVVLSDATLHLFVCSTERSRARASKKCMSSEITCLQWQQIGGHGGQL